MYRIAVVEDNPDNRLLLDALLGARYELLEHETGIDALAAFASDVPDLVLLDISLPYVDGVEVLRRLRAEPRTRELPVIALTANAMVGDREKYLAAGFDDYLAKPITDRAQLETTIERWLAARR